MLVGTERVPLDGLEPPFTLTGTSKPVDSLPVAHTCFNQLVGSICTVIVCAVLSR